MPSPPRDQEPEADRPLSPTRSVDPILLEGLRTYTEQGATAWQLYLQQHPSRAAQLTGLLHRLESVGIDPRGLPPTRLGPFEVLGKHGDGGMGIVWRCRRDGDDRHYAVKVVRPELLGAPGARERFVREMRTVSSLHHPGIVAIEAVDDAEPAPWYAMELVEGKPFDEIVRQAQPAGPTRVPAGALAALGVGEGETESAQAWIRGVLQVVAQVAEALAFAHSRGVVHRDVKPSNILVTPEGRAVLIDFGLARPADATTITAAGLELGSLPYMAPEQLRGIADPDARGDVYSLGVTLYQGLTLESPFQTSTAEGTRRAVLRAVTRPLRALNPNVGNDLATVCQVAMDPEPRRRYPNADEFARDLRRLLAGERPHARAPGPWLRMRRWAHNHPARAFGAFAAVLLLVVLPSAVAWQQSRALAINLRLSDLHLVQDLAEKERTLWPARPERLGGAEGMDAWLATAGEVIGRRARHRADLEALRQRATRIDEAEAVQRSDAARRLQKEIALLQNNIDQAKQQQMAGWADWVAQLQGAQAPLQRRLDEIYRYVLDDDEDLIAFRRLAELAIRIDEIEVLARRVGDRRSRAPELARRSLVDAAPLWQQTLTAIGDRSANPRYRGLRFEPQFGLVPLGRDPHSGLFEFAHLPSGRAPQRGPDGKLVLTDDCGIVLVLLPGGNARIGSDLLPAEPHYDPEAREEETPSVLVRLDPFLLAKHELTHGQWQRQMGSFTGTWKPGYVPCDGAAPVTLLHPVQPISPRMAAMVVRQLGLELPTGAQWEYGARGGTPTPWWTGREPASLIGAENLYDVGTGRLTDHNNPNASNWDGIQPADAWPFTAPVDALLPNPFGLHHVLGNASELCRDAARSYRSALRDGDGCTDNVDNGSIRLGAFSCLPGSCRVARRGDVGYDSNQGGVRAMRSLEGHWTIDPDLPRDR